MVKRQSMAADAILSYKLARAGRIQGVIEGGSGRTNTAFYRSLKAAGKRSLESTVRGWVLPPEKWSWDRETNTWTPQPGRRTAARADAEALKAPRDGALVDFCEFTGADPVFILTGSGPAYQGQDRSVPSLEADLAAAVVRRVRERCAETGIEIDSPDDPDDPDEWIHHSAWLRRELFVNALADAVFDDLKAWSQYYDAVRAMQTLALLLSYVPHDELQEREAFELVVKYVLRSPPQTKFVTGLDSKGEETSWIAPWLILSPEVDG